MSSGRRSLFKKCTRTKSEPLPQLPKQCQRKRRRQSTSRLMKKKQSIQEILDDESRIGEIEYTKVVIKALREAIKENDDLRKYVAQINKDNEQLKEDLEQRGMVILELAEYYKYCQDNHLLTKCPIKRKSITSFLALNSNTNTNKNTDVKLNTKLKVKGKRVKK